MKTQSRDTSPESEAVLVEGYRRMSGAAKMRRVAELNAAVRAVARARLEKTYPGASPRELDLRLAALWIDRDTMVRVFAWDPVVEGY